MKLRFDEKTEFFDVVLQAGNCLNVSSETAERRSYLRIGLQGGKLHLIGGAAIIHKIEGEEMENVVSETIRTKIQMAALEWLIAEGSVGTLVDIARLFGKQLSALSSTAKQIMKNGAFPIKNTPHFKNSEDSRRYLEAHEVCKA